MSFHEVNIAVRAQNEASEAFREVQADGERLGVSMTSLAVKVSGVVTAGVALYGMWAQIENAQIAVSAATKEVHESHVTIAEYQRRLNKLIAEGKVGSEEYALLQQRLAVNEELLAVKKDRLAMAQRNVTRSYVVASATVVPTLITGINSLSQVYGMLKTVKWANVSASVASSLADIKSAVASKISAAATWILNASLAMKISLLTLGVGLVAATAAYMVWLASATREAAAAQTEYNTALAESPTHYRSIRRAGEEDYYRRGIED